MIAGLCAQSTAGCRQRGGDRGDEGGEQSQQTYQQMGGKMFCPRSLHADPSFYPPLTVTASFFASLSSADKNKAGSDFVCKLVPYISFASGPLLQLSSHFF